MLVVPVPATSSARRRFFFGGAGRASGLAGWIGFVGGSSGASLTVNSSRSSSLARSSFGLVSLVQNLGFLVLGSQILGGSLLWSGGDGGRGSRSARLGSGCRPSGSGSGVLHRVAQLALLPDAPWPTAVLVMHVHVRRPGCAAATAGGRTTSGSASLPMRSIASSNDSSSRRRPTSVWQYVQPWYQPGPWPRQSDPDTHARGSGSRRCHAGAPPVRVATAAPAVLVRPVRVPRRANAGCGCADCGCAGCASAGCGCAGCGCGTHACCSWRVHVPVRVCARLPKVLGRPRDGERAAHLAGAARLRARAIVAERAGQSTLGGGGDGGGGGSGGGGRIPEVATEAVGLAAGGGLGDWRMVLAWSMLCTE